MKVALLLLAASIALAGCATGSSSDSSGYSDEKWTAAGAKPYQMVATDPHGKQGPWYAYDVAADSKIMISPTYGAAMAMGMQGGAMRNPEGFIPHQPFYEELALRYFKENGKPNCKIARGYKVSQAQYEFLYECAAPAPTKRRT